MAETQELSAPRVIRSGRGYSMASSEFTVTYPDGHVASLWSPPWHEWDEAEEQRQAEAKAAQLWRDKFHRAGGHTMGT